MNVTDFFCKNETKYIVSKADYTKTIYQHKYSFASITVGKKDDSKRYVCQGGSNNRQHCCDTSNSKPEPGFFNSDNQITDQCNDTLQHSDHGNTNCITQYHIFYFFP